MRRSCTARQHMFTAVSVKAFLNSLFSINEDKRSNSLNYLLEILPHENSSEVRGSTGAAARGGLFTHLAIN